MKHFLRHIIAVVCERELQIYCKSISLVYNVLQCVGVGQATSDRFTTTSGVRQRCVLTLALFCRAID